jgi:hypothetical protein
LSLEMLFCTADAALATSAAMLRAFSEPSKSVC